MSLRLPSLVLLVVGIVLLIIGFAVDSDILGAVFIVCLGLAIALFATDIVLRRRSDARVATGAGPEDGAS